MAVVVVEVGNGVVLFHLCCDSPTHHFAYARARTTTNGSTSVASLAYVNVQLTLMANLENTIDISSHERKGTE